MACLAERLMSYASLPASTLEKIWRLCLVAFVGA